MVRMMYAATINQTTTLPKITAHNANNFQLDAMQNNVKNSLISLLVSLIRENFSKPKD